MNRVIRWSTALVVVVLAAVAAIVSYRHAYEVVVLYGEAGFTATLVPLTVDGLVYSSSMVMLDCARRSVRVPRLARWALALGIAATLAANVVHGLDNGPVGAIVAAWPAVALIIAYELLMLIIRAAVPEGVAIADALPVVEVEDRHSVTTLADVPAISVDLPAEIPARVSGLEELFAAARERYAHEVAEGRIPTVNRLRSEMKIGQPKAQKVQTHLGLFAG